MRQRTEEQLREELARVNAENAELVRQLVQESTGGSAAPADASPRESVSARRGRKGRAWGRTVLSVAFVTVGALLGPVAIVSAWAERELTDTAYFVDTFAPLAQQPAVQDFVAGEALAAIDSAVDIDQVADDLFSGLDGLDLSPRAQNALELLKAPAVSGVKGLITNTVTDFVRSDAFATIWRDALTITHEQLVNTATGQEDAAVTVGRNQEVSLQLGPIVQAVKEHLVAGGFTLAARIPAIDRSIVIAQSSSVGTLLAIYQIVVAVGTWLPWFAFLILAAGVIVARRRALALAWASGALLLSMALTGAAITVGAGIVAVMVAPTIPHDAAVALYSGVTAFVSSLVVVVAVLAAKVLAITLIAGPWQWSRALRGYGHTAFAAIRRGAERHGITTGSAGELVHRWLQPLRVLVGMACAVFLVLARPLSPATIVWTALVGVAVVVLLELVSRPPSTEATLAD